MHRFTKFPLAIVALGGYFAANGTYAHSPVGTPAAAPEPAAPINIGITIRSFRLERGMSQGDIEKRTGLLRCYLSRVENGHTVPSLETLQKIAAALNLPLSQFFFPKARSRKFPV